MSESNNSLNDALNDSYDSNDDYELYLVNNQHIENI